MGVESTSSKKDWRIEDVQLGDFGDVVLFECTHCGRCVESGSSLCVHCGRPNDSNRLWLQIQCCGELLWAYNWQHLAFIRDLVGRKQRRSSSFRPPSNSLARKLPKWITAAKNRDEVLKSINRLIKEKL